ncbi:MAG: hypothetical protein H0X37_17495, partial [Herpetosiphonaceae bacterium]|nr:hypothetical protein [Herpetosiphonaceae bacterium]
MVPLMHLVRRLGRQRLVSASILLGVGLAVALGVAVPLVTGALAALSLRTSITTLTPAVRNIQLFRTPAPFDPSLQAHIRQQLGSLLAADYRMSYLPTVYGQPAAPRPNRQVRLRTQEGLADHIVVTARASQPASTPAPGDCQPHGSTFPVLVSAEQLQASTLAVGDHVCVDGKISVMIAGNFVPKDPTDQYWFNDQRPIIGESPPGPTITTLIVVLMLNDDDFNTIWLRWYGNELVAHFFRGFVQSSAITLDTVDDVANHLDALRAEFKAVSSSPIVMQTGLEDAITTFETRFQLLESVLFALFLLLVSLAMIYVVLVGTLATQQQEGEIALLRSRGGSARQVLLVQICQSLVLAIPSAV